MKLLKTFRIVKMELVKMQKKPKKNINELM